MAKFQVWKSKNDGDYYWRHWSDKNNNEIARSSEGYETKQGAIDSVKWVKANAEAEIVEL